MNVPIVPIVPIAGDVTRADVDRVRRISLRIGGPMTVGALAVCDEAVRLRRLCSEVYDLLCQGEDREAMERLADEIDPSWDRLLDGNLSPKREIPMDCGIPVMENAGPVGGAA